MERRSQRSRAGCRIRGDTLRSSQSANIVPAEACDREADSERRHVGDQQHERHRHEQARQVLRHGDRGGAPGEAEAEHARGAHAART